MRHGSKTARRFLKSQASVAPPRFGLFQELADVLRLTHTENPFLDQRQTTFGHFEVLNGGALHDVNQLFVSLAFRADGPPERTLCERRGML
jgi:hypothetical protein